MLVLGAAQEIGFLQNEQLKIGVLIGVKLKILGIELERPNIMLVFQLREQV